MSESETALLLSLLIKSTDGLDQRFPRSDALSLSTWPVLGEGPDRAKLTALACELGIREHVDFPGFQPIPFAHMARARVFVLSSAREGLPSVLIQAMACGTPVVSTDCPSGPREVLEGGKWGRLVPVGDYRALAEAIRDTFDRPVARRV